MASGPITFRWGKVEALTDFIFLDSKITANGDCSHEIKTCLLLGRKAMTNLDNILKSRDITLPTKVCGVEQCRDDRLSSSQVQMWDLAHKEGWVPKNWCFWIVVQEKILKSPLKCKEIKPVNPKGNQPWIFIGRTIAEAPILGHLIQKASSLEKTDAGTYWGQEGEGGGRRWDCWMA